MIDEVEVKRVKELSPRDIEHDNPEFRRLDETIHFLEQIYGRSVSEDDIVTVVRFSEIKETPTRVLRAPARLGAAPELAPRHSPGDECHNLALSLLECQAEKDSIRRSNE